MPHKQLSFGTTIMRCFCVFQSGIKVNTKIDEIQQKNWSVLTHPISLVMRWKNFRKRVSLYTSSDKARNAYISLSTITFFIM